MSISEDKLFVEWNESSIHDIRLYIQLHVKAVRTFLDELHNAIVCQQPDSWRLSLLHFLSEAHKVLFKFCGKIFYIERDFCPHLVLKLSTRTSIELFTGELLYLINEICKISGDLKKKRAHLILLRILHKISLRLEKYFLKLNYWVEKDKPECEEYC